MAIRLLPLLLEGALVELLQAERTYKMFRMELAEHGRDAATGNGLVASGAEGAAQGVEVGLAVRLALVLKEVSVGEGLPASDAYKAP